MKYREVFCAYRDRKSCNDNKKREKKKETCAELLNENVKLADGCCGGELVWWVLGEVWRFFEGFGELSSGL
jgi:hypothetical protein